VPNQRQVSGWHEIGHLSCCGAALSLRIGEGKFPFVIASKAKQSLHLPYGIASSLTLLAMTKALKG